jgi:hypothetical protein
MMLFQCGQKNFGLQWSNYDVFRNMAKGLPAGGLSL